MNKTLFRRIFIVIPLISLIFSSESSEVVDVSSPIYSIEASPLVLNAMNYNASVANNNLQSGENFIYTPTNNSELVTMSRDDETIYQFTVELIESNKLLVSVFNPKTGITFKQ